MITYDETIHFNEWQMVENEKSKAVHKINRKVPLSLKFARFRKVLVQGLQQLKDHLKWVHLQFQAFKLAKEEAVSKPIVVTMQLDWSKKVRIRQSCEKKSAYYHEDQISIHSINIWTHERKYSRAALSNCTDHKSGAVFTSIKPVLNDFVKEKNMINIISYSPTSQYCNKKIFWMIQSFARKQKINIKWIYLESCHGKGLRPQ